MLTSLKYAMSSYHRELELGNLLALPLLWGRREAYSWEKHSPRRDQMGAERFPGTLEHQVQGPAHVLDMAKPFPLFLNFCLRISVILSIILSSK